MVMDNNVVCMVEGIGSVTLKFKNGLFYLNVMHSIIHYVPQVLSFKNRSINTVEKLIGSKFK